MRARKRRESAQEEGGEFNRPNLRPNLLVLFRTFQGVFRTDTLKIRSRADDGQSKNGAPGPTNIDSTNESPMSTALEYTSCNTVSQVFACVSNSRTPYDKAGRIARR